MTKKILIVKDPGSFYNKDWTSGYKGMQQQTSHHMRGSRRAGSNFHGYGPPGFDGIKTTATLKQNPKTSHIPVVTLTAWVSELWREKALKVGIVDYQLKPVSPQVLKQTIEKFTKAIA